MKAAMFKQMKANNAAFKQMKAFIYMHNAFENHKTKLQTLPYDLVNPETPSSSLANTFFTLAQTLISALHSSSSCCCKQ